MHVTKSTPSSSDLGFTVGELSSDRLTPLLHLALRFPTSHTSRMSDADEREPQQDSVPIAAPSASPGLPSESPASTSLPRHVATARLASPIPNNAELQDASSRRAATPLQAVAEREPDFKGKAVASSPNKPGDSILTSGLRNVSSSPAPEEPPSRSGSPPSAETGPKFNLTGEENSPRNTPAPTENPQIIRRHLVQPQGNTSEVNNENSSESEDSTVKNPADVDEFSSLQLQGGDITRPVYRWTEEAEAQEASRRRRSFDVPRPEPESATLDIGSIKIPGGFRRDYLRRAAGGAESNGLHSSTGRDGPQLPTRSFLEFLTLYGHFAGEELEEDDEALGPDEYFVPELWREGEEEIGEETALLPPGAPGKHPRRHRDRAPKATNSATGAMLLLLKSFVGTGILFLPRAFLNGGMLFSSVVLSWQLLIGTAIFTYEGVSLIIPIQESMKRPQQFPRVLALCMIVITVIFLSSGVLGYATFGSATETVVLLNLPQDDKFVNGVQFLYSIAILLSTPLQLFPAIRIMENGLFTRSGKYNPGIKWKKNIFRFFLVVICAVVAWGGAADLDKFVALVGSFACVPLVYVYPPLLHWKAVATTRFRRWSDIALAVFGTLIRKSTSILLRRFATFNQPFSRLPSQF
ncbi:Avt4p [Coccidioides immitis RMSCC 3703]|uniref:Avt4p n=1 Tax=Coccidioides immitis RMSCC 3703 TaxID=454286 RepID=A0A0J8QSH8_COCIT|nr:Avt4p [Coccidioides immitis RMSCC 3703]